jgi:DNA-binding CsgD family transcriptional regulator
VNQDDRTWPELWFARDDTARLIVAHDLVVIAASAGARRMLGDKSGDLQLRDDLLTAQHPQTAAELAAALAEADAEPRLRVIGRGASEGFLVEILALGPGPGDPVALTLRDLSRPVVVESAYLGSKFDVTPGEYQVIVRLLQGHSSRDIAEQTGKSILTIRTHVKRAYGKIGVKSRGQLFARLLPYLWIR